MRSPNNEDWDLCWHYLSSTGCRNSNCRWRHENSVGSFYQKYVLKTRSKGISYRGDPGKTRGAKFYPIKQHQDGGVGDQYGLIHYPDMDEKDGLKNNKFRKNILRYGQESEHTHAFLSPMSVSDSEVLHGEVKTPRRRMTRERLPGKAIISCLSPFAKAFVPRKSVMSKDGISAGLNEMTRENSAVNTIQQRANLKSCLTEDDEVFE